MELVELAEVPHPDEELPIPAPADMPTELVSTIIVLFGVYEILHNGGDFWVRFMDESGHFGPQIGDNVETLADAFGIVSDSVRSNPPWSS